jgi:hypothetical protein
MMRVSVFAFTLIALSSSLTAAQYPCALPTSNEWLREGVYSGNDAKISADLVHPVKNDLSHAISMLEKNAVVPLSGAEARKFAGPNPRLPSTSGSDRI